MQSPLKLAIAASLAVAGSASFAQTYFQSFDGFGNAATTVTSGLFAGEQLSGNNADGFMLLNPTDGVAAGSVTTTTGTGARISFAYLVNPTGLTDALLTVSRGGLTLNSYDLIDRGAGNPGTVNFDETFLNGPGEYTFTFSRTRGNLRVDNFTVTSVPEPEAYALALAGLGVLGFVARRRKQA